MFIWNMVLRNTSKELCNTMKDSQIGVGVIKSINKLVVEFSKEINPWKSRMSSFLKQSPLHDHIKVHVIAIYLGHVDDLNCASIINISRIIKMLIKVGNWYILGINNLNFIKMSSVWPYPLIEVPISLNKLLNWVGFSYAGLENSIFSV